MRVWVNLTARDGKPQVTGVLDNQKVRRESAAAGGARRAVGASAWRWGGSWAYERVVRVVEKGYGTPGLGVQGGLRGAFRDGLEAGV